ncbi:MAG: AAA family ATPase, partial [Planctomycetaceae bacterium]
GGGGGVGVVGGIDRATPRKQSALLEAMAERQVTVDAVRYERSREFLVIATQNPTEQHGTYPLPEAQLDRFSMKLSIGYPAPEEELQMLADALTHDDCPGEILPPVLSPLELLRLQHITAQLEVVPAVREYLVRLATASRSHSRIALGLSPRGLLIWQRAAQARAVVQGRWFVTPDDVQAVAVPVLSVRLVCDAERPVSVIEELLEQTAVPGTGGMRGEARP